MLRKYFIFFIFFIFNFLTFAQDNSIKMKPVINLEIAKIMADACENHQSKTGYRPVNIAIVDAGGDLVLFRRQNDAYLLSIDIAILSYRYDIISISNRCRIDIVSYRYRINILSISYRYPIDIVSLSYRYDIDIVSIRYRYRIDVASIESI